MLRFLVDGHHPRLFTEPTLPSPQSSRVRLAPAALPAAGVSAWARELCSL